MILKTLFILGDIGFFSKNLSSIVNYINKDTCSNDVITLLGDNFYPFGVYGNSDPLWNEYSNIFSNVDTPIYSVLGNHDYLQNPNCQINNSKWTMDSWYYKKEYDNIDLYFLDTVQFNIHTWVSKAKIEEIHGKSYQVLIDEQLNWLDMELSKQPNKKKIVLGHYPIITNGAYYNSVSNLFNYLIEIFEKHKVSLYISGHEHNIQLLRRKINNLNFNQIIIGSSSEYRDFEENQQQDKKDMFDNKEYFYGKMHIYDNYVVIKYINDQNKLKHQFKINF